MVPSTAGMVVLAYNLPGVRGELRLPRDVYPGVLSGQIRYWDDPRIRKANPDFALPHRDIVIVARRDGSGTTFALTSHLAAVSRTWREQGLGVGKLVEMALGHDAGLRQRGCRLADQDQRRLDRLCRVRLRQAARPPGGSPA